MGSENGYFKKSGISKCQYHNQVAITINSLNQRSTQGWEKKEYIKNFPLLELYQKARKKGNDKNRCSIVDQ